MEITLQATKRESFGKQNRKLRKEGLVPAVLYGKGKESTPIQVSLADFSKVYKDAGENTLVGLAVEGGKETKVLIQDVAKHYMKDLPTHVDFYEVDLTKKIHAKIPIHFVGDSPAVKAFGGVLLRSVDEVEVEALPQDLPKNIVVDLGALKELNDLIRISDLAVGENVTMFSNPEDAIAIVKPPRTQAEIEALDEEIADDGVPSEEGEEGEDSEEGKEDGEAEGEGGDEKVADEGADEKKEEKPAE